MSTKFSAINTARRVIVIIGCLLFLFSFVSPFYYGQPSDFSGYGGPFYYWSYEVAREFAQHSNQYRFSNFWFSSYDVVGVVALGIPWVLISLFAVQVLTLVFGVAFIVSKRRILSFEPIMLSTVVLVLMVYAAKVISGFFYTSSSQYQLGYYLVYPSIAMFLFAFLLNEFVKKRQTTSRDTSIPVIDTPHPHSNRRQTRGRE